MMAELKEQLQEAQIELEKLSRMRAKPQVRKTSPVRFNFHKNIGFQANASSAEQEENGESGASAGWSDVGELDVGDETEPPTVVAAPTVKQEPKQVASKESSPSESPRSKKTSISMEKFALTDVMEVAKLKAEIRRIEGERDKYR